MDEKLPRIQRKYITLPGEPIDPWEDVSLAEFVRRTEWGGYFAKDMALKALIQRRNITTPYAEFRIPKGD